MGELLRMPVLPGDEGLTPSKCLAVGISRLLNGAASKKAVGYLSRAVAKKKNVRALVHLGWEMVQQGGHEKNLLAISMALHGVQGDEEVNAMRNFFRVEAWRQLKPSNVFAGTVQGAAAQLVIQRRIVGKREKYGLLGKIAERYERILVEVGQAEACELRVG